MFRLQGFRVQRRWGEQSCLRQLDGRKLLQSTNKYVLVPVTRLQMVQLQVFRVPASGHLIAAGTRPQSVAAQTHAQSLLEAGMVTVYWDWQHDWPDSLVLSPAQVHTRKLRLDADVDDEVLRQVARDLPGLYGTAQALLPCDCDSARPLHTPIMSADF